MSEYTVIINTTPLGMYPHTATCPPIPYEQLTNKHLVYDLIYNPDQTLFMEKASKQGAVTKWTRNVTAASFCIMGHLASINKN